MTAGSTILTIEKLQKSFGTKATLRGVDLELHSGELLGLVGPNGAGKSTLLRCLIGLVSRDSGSIDVLGHDPKNAALAIRRQCSYLPGETGVYHQMTGERFLRFALGFYPHHQAELRDRLTAEFELPLAHKVRSYSAGMKQKLALMATLIPDVPLYILDEPDRALDASVRFFLRDVLRDQKRAGKTILLSSHHLTEVETLADRLEFLIDGRMIPGRRLQRARAELRRQPRIRLTAGTKLPDLPEGAIVLRTEPDGTLVLETESDPLLWLRKLPPEVVESAEVGVVRLEDLYRLLLQPDDQAPAEVIS